MELDEDQFLREEPSAEHRAAAAVAAQQPEVQARAQRVADAANAGGFNIR